jgi:hypothetical protein
LQNYAFLTRFIVAVFGKLSTPARFVDKFLYGWRFATKKGRELVAAFVFRVL